MEKQTYHRTITVKASPEEAMKKISQVNLWWAKKVEGKTDKLNDKFTVDFGETFVDFQISELIPNKKLLRLQFHQIHGTRKSSVLRFQNLTMHICLFLQKQTDQ